jgi:hypothetical protein
MACFSVFVFLFSLLCWDSGLWKEKMKGRLLIAGLLAQSLFRTRPEIPEVKTSTDFNDKLRQQREHDMKQPSKRRLSKMKGKR